MLHVFWSIIVQSGASSAVLCFERLQILTLVRQLCYSDGVLLVNAPEFHIYIFH